MQYIEFDHQCLLFKCVPLSPNPVRYAKAYVNQFLPLPNGMNSHSVYLY